MNNIVKFVEKNGCIILTFDMPGYEYKTNLSLYKEILVKNNFEFICEDTKEDDRITTSSSLIAALDLKKMNLSCYRLFAWR